MLNRTLMRTKFNELHVYVFNIPASGKLNVLTPASIIPLGVECTTSKLQKMITDLQEGQQMNSE